MKFTRFRLLFLLMCLALAGGIALQAYWLKNAVNMEREKFDRDVKAALAQAATTIESNLARVLIGRTMDKDLMQVNITGPALPPSHMFTYTATDSVKQLRLTSMVCDSNSPMGNIQMFITDDDSTLPGHGPYTFERRKDVFRSAVNDAFVQYVIRGAPPQDQLQQKDVEKALRRSFAAKGLDIQYEYAVLGNYPAGKEIISNHTARASLASSKYKTLIFPGDGHNGASALSVSFASPAGFIVRTLWPQFLLSFFITAALITVFFLTFREMLRQKKLSDIRNDFINNMTHEFKTPIATISLAADTAMNDAIINSPEKVRHYLELVKQENRRMNEQVEKVLQAALAERGELRLQREACDLSQLVRRAADSFRLRIEAAGGQIELDLPEEAPVTGDPFHLEKAIANLIDNAVKYSSGAPVVTITARHEIGKTILTVADRGIGIGKEEQHRIFDKFYRVSTGNLHDVKGFGLGLSYVKSVMAAHEGTATVSSAPGKGSTFILTFPYAG